MQHTCTHYSADWSDHLAIATSKHCSLLGWPTEWKIHRSPNPLFSHQPAAAVFGGGLHFIAIKPSEQICEISVLWINPPSSVFFFPLACMAMASWRSYQHRSKGLFVCSLMDGYCRWAALFFLKKSFRLCPVVLNAQGHKMDLEISIVFTV